MSIQIQEGIISHVTDLTKTAKEVIITLADALVCPPGSFVNFFIELSGAPVRRAYSVVNANAEQKTVTFSVRHTLNGVVTPEFWKDDIIGRTVRVMGPLGLNTADKLSHATVHLFAYGIGAGVIKAIAEYSLQNPTVTTMTITTGSRNEEDIVYKSYFDEIAKDNPHVTVKYVISDPLDQSYPFKGYVQDHLEGLSFDDSDIYMCGQEKACNALLEKIKATNPQNTSFFVEAFH
ncbi:MAG: FAD-binding oxidoreductase [Candidatus Kaiserbacteria bacterium]|nr:FAD-binding oxidoreductase [Candidatus Kaiserbacteria bacterium]